VLFLAGWLAIGIVYFVPVTIAPLFGNEFLPAKRLLPFFALLAIAKGGEITLYRLLYAVRRQHRYVIALSVATVMMVVLNFALIPTFGLEGAVISGICSISVVVTICAVALRDRLALRTLAVIGARLGLALAAAIVSGELLRRLGGSMWIVAIGPCLIFPIAAVVVGLIPHPRRSPLFNQNTHSDEIAAG
jgi:O-antigen/teichoic acid export membrane protein